MNPHARILDPPADPGSWARLKTIVADALEAPPDHREAVLRNACDDPTTLAEAHRLVRASAGSDALLNRHTDTWVGLAGGCLGDLVGSTFGKFDLLERVGEGAAGVVYLARQRDLDRPVALKLLRTHLLAVDAETRFRREVDALSRIEHPGVARIYEAGVRRDGDGRRVPFIAMEYVPGQPVTTYVRDSNLGIRARVRLLADVCDAVHAAHQRAVVHRDIKPGNVLVTDDGVAKLVDFSVAHVDADPEVGYSVRTGSGLLLGTLGYMSPEQLDAAAAPADPPDVRTDVYALGVLAYEVLAGRPPIDVRGLPLPAAVRAVTEQAVVPLGRRVPAAAGDLQTIVDKAMSPEVARRYDSAAALGDDLRRWGADLPVRARPPTLAYVTRKFVRRRRVPLLVAAAFAAVGAGGLVAGIVGYVQTRHARDAAEAALTTAVAEQQRTQAINRYLQRLFTAPDPALRGRDARIIDWITTQEPLLAAELSSDPSTESTLRWLFGWTLFSLEAYDEALMQFGAAADLARPAAEAGDADAIDQWAAAVGDTVMTLRLADRSHEARAALDATWPDLVRLLPPNDRQWIDLRTELAMLLGGRGHVVDALAELESLLHEVAALPWDDNVATLDHAVRSGIVDLLLQSDDPRALAAARDMLDYTIRTLGDRHPSTVTSLTNLAHACTAAGKDAQALDLHARSVALATDLWGDDAMSTLGTREALAGALAALGRFDEAETIYADVRYQLQTLVGDGHQTTQRVANNYATLLCHAGRWPEARLLLEPAADYFAETLGTDHPRTLSARQNLANALGALGEVESAASQLADVIEGQTRTAGRDAPTTLITRNNLAMLWFEHGRPADAAVELEAVTDAALSAGLDPMAAQFLRNLARARAAAGDPRAESTFRRALDHALPHLPEHQQRRTATFFVQFLEEQGREEEAQALTRLYGGPQE